MRIQETYSKGTHRHLISLNAPSVRIPVRVDTVAKATLYNPNFYHAPSKLWYILGASLIIGAIYGIYRLYGWWQRRKLNNARQKVEDQT